MHLLGKSIRVELNPGTARKVLLDIPNWDFHWQNATRSRICRGGARRRAACDVRTSPRGAVTAGTGSRRRLGTSCGARARRTRCLGRCRSRAGSAPAPLRILLVSQMYPGPEDPDFGVFVQGLEQALRDRGHEIERAVVDRRSGGKRRYVELARRARAAARAFRPTSSTRTSSFPPASSPRRRRGRLSSSPRMVRTSQMRLATRPARDALCVPARGRRGRRLGLPARRARARRPEARGKTDVVDCGVDVERFPSSRHRTCQRRILFVGTLIERKNVVRLADAFARLGDGEATLTVLGDGPLRAGLEGSAASGSSAPCPTAR